MTEPTAVPDDGPTGRQRAELLVVPDCPSHPPAAALFRRVLDEIGAGHLSIRVVVVENPEQATDLAFAGSPTFRLDGLDLLPDPDAVVGFACRRYRTGSGAAVLPDPADLRAALVAGLTPRAAV